MVSADPSALSEAVQGITQVWSLTQLYSGCLFCVNEFVLYSSIVLVPSCSNSLSLQYRRPVLRVFFANLEPINGPQSTSPRILLPELQGYGHRCQMYRTVLCNCPNIGSKPRMCVCRKKPLQGSLVVKNYRRSTTSY